MRSTVTPVYKPTPSAWQAWASRPMSSEFFAPWLQPVAQSPQPMQAASGTPATVPVSARSATVIGTSVLRCACSRFSTAVLRRPASGVPATVLGWPDGPALSQWCTSSKWRLRPSPARIAVGQVGCHNRCRR